MWAITRADPSPRSLLQATVVRGRRQGLQEDVKSLVLLKPAGAEQDELVGRDGRPKAKIGNRVRPGQRVDRREIDRVGNDANP